MQIITEGTIGIVLTLIFALGAGAIVRFPNQRWIGTAVMTVAVLGLLATGTAWYFGPSNTRVAATPLAAASVPSPAPANNLPTTRLENSPITGFAIGIENNGCVNTELKNSPINGAVKGITNNCHNDR